MAKNRTKRHIGIDLFAGAGGLTLGFEQAGFDVVAAVEIDPIHAAVHEFNFPHCATLCRSVVDVSGAEIRTEAGIGNSDIDVVFGGAPCQGFSMIGKRALDDPRNSLVQHFVRLVSELNPKYFVFENVKGLTLGRHRQFLVELIETMKDAGYEVVENYQVLNAADYGVPQDRRRLFLLGARKGQKIPAYPGPIPRVSVKDAISDLPNADKYPELITSDSVRATYKTKSKYAQRLRGLEDDPTDFSYRRLFDINLLTSSLRTEHTPLSQSRFLATANGATEPISRFHKLNPDGVCNTLRAGTASDRGAFTSPRPIHHKYPRVITVREAARLHSYPDWFRFHATKWHGFRQIGNSVPPLLGRAVASKIIEAIGIKPTRPKAPMPMGSESWLTATMAVASAKFGVSANVIAKRARLGIKSD